MTFYPKNDLARDAWEDQCLSRIDPRERERAVGFAQKERVEAALRLGQRGVLTCWIGAPDTPDQDVLLCVPGPMWPRPHPTLWRGGGGDAA